MSLVMKVVARISSPLSLAVDNGRRGGDLDRLVRRRCICSEQHDIVLVLLNCVDSEEVTCVDCGAGGATSVPCVRSEGRLLRPPSTSYPVGSDIGIQSSGPREG